MRARIQLLCLLFGLGLSGAALAQDLDAIVERVLPDPSERVWEALDWHSTLWDAVIDAHKAKQPILLWAMNGHPLGHT